MPVFIEPFDFKTTLINYFLGTTELFIFAFIIVFAYLGAKLQMSNKLFLSMLAIGAVMISAFLGQGIYVFVIFIIGLISFKGISRIVT